MPFDEDVHNFIFCLLQSIGCIKRCLCEKKKLRLHVKGKRFGASFVK